MLTKKLLLHYLLFSLLIILTGLFSIYQFRQIEKPLEKDIPLAIDTVRETSESIEIAWFIKYYDEVLTQSARNYAYTASRKWKERYRGTEVLLDGCIKSAIAQGDSIDRALFARIDEANIALVAMERDAMLAVDNKTNQRAVQILESDTYRKWKDHYAAGLNEYMSRRDTLRNNAMVFSVDKISRTKSKSQQLLSRGKNIITTSILVALLITVALAISSSVTISRPLTKLTTAVAAVSEGNFESRVDITSKNEIGILARSFNRMAERIMLTTVSVDALGEEMENRKKAERRITDMNKRYQLFADTTNDGLISLDEKGVIIYWNKAAEKIFGYTEAEIHGRELITLIPEKYREHYKGGLRETLFNRGHAVIGKTIKLVGLTKTGTEIQLEISTSTWMDGDHAIFSGIVRDISERTAMEKDLFRMANHDSLTDLPNRRMFSDYLTLALARAERNRSQVAVIFIDIDDFKLVNDTLGHQEGDNLIKCVAERLNESKRKADLLARLGGDEFGIIIGDLNKTEDIIKINERLFSCIKAPFYLQGQNIIVTLSIGISIYPSDAEDALTLIKNADIAMYNAKKAGKDNFLLFTPCMNQVIIKRMEFEKNIHSALDNEEFELHYQPQIDLKTGDVIGFEALLRWFKPDGKSVPPGEIIPFAEETGLIIPIGEWVLRTACRQHADWEKKGIMTLPISINVSVKQFQQTNAVDAIAGVLQEFNMDPGNLIIEITESVLMENVDLIISSLNELKSRGIKIAIDDFGTGYSSLRYLQQFPLDILKIDRTFVKDVTTNPNDAAIANTICQIARSLRLEVIAEGVETVEQENLLRSFGCDGMQGFLISRALPADKIQKFLIKHYQSEGASASRYARTAQSL